MLRKQQVQLQLCSINKTKTHQYFTVNCAKTTNKSFNYQKKKQTHLGIELCFHIFIAQLNYSHALKKKKAEFELARHPLHGGAVRVYIYDMEQLQ
jgi:hypothetical protein